MRRILVTGATGFLARHLIPALEHTGDWEVFAAASKAVAPPWVDAQRYVAVDVGSEPSVDALVSDVRPDALVHAAAKVRAPAAELCRTNVVGTANVLCATRTHCPGCRLILVGSAAEYGAVSESALPIREDTPCAPMDVYGISKLAATELTLEAARSWHAKVTVVRPFNIVGAFMPAYLVGGAVLERVHAAAAAEPPQRIRIGRTDTRRDFVAVDDVVGALLKLLDIDERGEVYNLASGRATAIEELLLALIELSSANLPWETDPSLVRSGDVPISYGSSEKARARFGFEPAVPIEQALRAAWNARVELARS